ncbi:hypothetical protein [Mycolicibacterium neworleansense]|uniref:hypothetical protein n=1 Tax=Mycolicibacterium neworleansense TaxID=146018 RepID=UPI00103946F4|nr:hypothetical protein [Mycolicibacterium neworleansense]MCV7360545.1 hypothetical protein [Mycolicibacterium neworleansense]
MTSDTGQATLSEITEYRWKDHGERAARLFAWIPEWANSKIPENEEMAGETAHAIAVFLADKSSKLLNLNSDSKDDDPRITVGEVNPNIVSSYTQAITPFLAAMVGDTSETSAFEPLDALDGPMPRSYAIFSVLGSDATSSRELGAAIVNLSEQYLDQVSAALKAYPISVESVNTDVRRAAQLLGLAMATGIQSPDSSPLIFNAEIAETELNYALALTSANPMNEDIDAKYFRDNALIEPEKVRQEFGEAAWDEYSGMLSRYVARSDELRAFSSLFSQTMAIIARR